MKVKVHTSFIGKTGYNAHARDFFTQLSKLVNLKIRNFTCGASWKGLNDDPHAGETYLTDYQKHLIGEQTVINSEGKFYDTQIYDGMSDFEDYDIDLLLNETNHRYYYDLDKFKGKFKIAYNVWESTRQPEHFFEYLLKFDQLWVPSEWQKQVTIEQGYPAEKIFVVPEAVDSTIFFPDKNKRILPEYKDNRFKFIVFGRWDYRKSTKELIQTFLKTFDKDEPVDLIMSVDNPYSVDGMKSTQERLDKYNLNDPRIKFLDFPSREDYINYLKNGHVFLSCARSEGWNLPLIEALACGTPSIYSDWGAQLQFAKGKGHPVKMIGEKPVDDSQTYGLGKPSSVSNYGEVSQVSVLGNFGEPDFDDLSKVMRDVYTHYWEYKGKALRDSKLVVEEFSWENAAIKAKKILDDIYTQLPKDNAPEPTVIAPVEHTDDYSNVEEQRHWNNKDAWTDAGNEWSKFFGTTDNLWNTFLLPKVDKYLKGDVLEIAPGFGRITQYLKDKADNLNIVDLNQLCIDKCKEKFGDSIGYYVNDGKSLNMFDDNSQDFVFSWDSFVHMDESVIREYLKEIYRVLKNDSYAIIHHSYLSGGQKESFKNLAGRSNMNPELFKTIAEEQSLKVIKQENFEWTITDTITTLYKPKQEFAFFTGGDEKYLSVVESCVKSMSKYSEIPIIVYGFNCDVPFDYPNMIKRRIDRNREKKFKDRDTRLYYLKIDASLDCLKNDDSKTYIWIDGDCIVTPNIDSIIKYRDKIDKYPLCMRYKHENLIHRRTTPINGYMEKGHGDELGDLFGIKRNANFTVATGLYMFDKRSKWFFDEVLYFHRYFLDSINAINNADDMALAEERLFNVLFWKYEFKNYLPITWVSNTYFTYEKGNEFTPKIENYIKSGFDIMFDFDGTEPLKNNLEDESKILFYHGQRDISQVDKLLEKFETNKLMIVAHPDDETIFGGGMLLNEDGWKVIVVTDGGGDNNDPTIRLKEFKSVMQHLNTEYEILGYQDDMNRVLYNETEVENKLREIILSRKWNKIVTHNQDGEYNHIIHKSVHNIVKRINPENLYFFEKSHQKLDSKLFKRKNMLLEFYHSQNTNLPGFRDYLIYEGTTEKSDNLNLLSEVKIQHIPDIIYKFDDLKAFVDIKDTIESEYHVEILDYNTNNSIYGLDLESNNWACTDRMEEQIKWQIKVSQGDDVIFEHIFDLKGRNVKVILNGDIEKIKTNLDIITKLVDNYDMSVFVATKFFNELRSEYPKILFNEIMKINYYATYNFNENDDLNKIFEKWLK